MIKKRKYRYREIVSTFNKLLDAYFLGQHRIGRLTRGHSVHFWEGILYNYVEPVCVQLRDGYLVSSDADPRLRRQIKYRLHHLGARFKEVSFKRAKLNNLDVTKARNHDLDVYVNKVIKAENEYSQHRDYERGYKRIKSS